MCVCGIGSPPHFLFFVLSRYLGVGDWGGWSVPCPQAPVAYFLDIISHEKWMFKYLCHFLPIHVKQDSFNNLGLQEGTCIYCLCRKCLFFVLRNCFFFCFFCLLAMSNCAFSTRFFQNQRMSILLYNTDHVYKNL